MTQTLKNQNIETQDVDEYYVKFFKTQEKLRPDVLEYLFQNITFITNREKLRALSVSEYDNVIKATGIPKVLVHKYISRFLVDLLKFKRLLSKCPQILNSRQNDRGLGIFLNRIYRIAPVFNYRRARENARRLKKKLDHLCFWPQLMTQAATVIYITDKLDKNKKDKIIQSNLRVLCCCSAYAFHRTRNKLGFK